MVSVTTWWTRPYVCVVVVGRGGGGMVISANKAEFEGDVKGLPYVV